MQPVPPSLPSVCAQRWKISGCNDGEIYVLTKMMGNSVHRVDPRSTHRASVRLLFSKHEVIDDERSIGRREQFAQPHSFDRFIAIIERRRTFKKLVIMNCCSRRKCTTQLRDMLTLSHQFDFCL